MARFERSWIISEIGECQLEDEQLKLETFSSSSSSPSSPVLSTAYFRVREIVSERCVALGLVEIDEDRNLKGCEVVNVLRLGRLDVCRLAGFLNLQVSLLVVQHIRD